MVFRLVVEEESGRGRRLVLPAGELLVGSAAECELRLDHPAVSRRHARIVVGDEVVVEDLGSRNGTRLAGRRIEGPAPVPVGAELVFGTVAARLERIDDAELEPAILLPGPPPAARAAAEPTPGATASIGSLQEFVLERLPPLLELAVERAEPSRLARAVGAALFDALPCLAVEVASPAGGVFFEARRGAPAADAVRLTERAAGLELRVDFPHPAAARAYAGLVATGARLVDLARPALAAPRAESPPAAAPPEPATLDGAVRKLYADASRVARGDVSVLLLGESGTGKELLARFLHRASPRSGGPFVALNCAALPRDLLEAELFGIERGVATGVHPRPGKFELAHGGTLFLDEIGDMAPETQARILRVLQEGEVFRVGGGEPRAADVRVVSATNRDLDRMRAEGGFRADLYHRIADWVGRLPPLRERRADVPNLAAHFLAAECERRGVRAAGISRAALDLLVAHDWPGNIRQLEREMARVALFLGPGELLESSHLSEEIRSVPRAGAGATLRERLEAHERREIERALAESSGDVGAAAERLGLGRSTLYRRIKELGLAEDAPPA